MTATVTDVKAGIESIFSASLIPAGYTAEAVLKLGYWEVTISDPAGVDVESHKVATDLKGNTLVVTTKPWGAPVGTVELPA